jgi:hypothetical protein
MRALYPYSLSYLSHNMHTEARTEAHVKVAAQAVHQTTWHPRLRPCHTHDEAPAWPHQA